MLNALFNHIPAFIIGCFCGVAVTAAGVFTFLYYLTKSTYNQVQNWEDSE